MPDEPTSSAAESDADPGYTDSGIPTFESVRDKIETRYETSIGTAELDAESPEGRDVEEQYEKRQPTGWPKSANRCTTAVRR